MDQAVSQGLIDRALLDRIGAAARPRVMEERVHRLFDEFRRIVAERRSCRWIDEGRQAGAVQAVDSLARLGENHFVQMAEAVIRDKKRILPCAAWCDG